MINILIDDYNNAYFNNGLIEKGIFDEVDPNTELWKITNDNGVFYAVSNGFSRYEVDDIPTGVEPIKYCYTVEKGFYKNPDYIEPIEVRISELENQNEELQDYIDTIMTEVIPSLMGE